MYLTEKIFTVLKHGLLILILGMLSGPVIHAQQSLNWLEFEQAISEADSTNRPILIDVWAPWCGWCQKMKEEVYPELKPILEEKFVLTRLNRDDNHTILHFRKQKFTPLKLAQQLKAENVPTVVLLNSEGEYLLHISGFAEASSLKSVLSYIASGTYQKQSFEAFKNQIEGK